MNTLKTLANTLTTAKVKQRLSDAALAADAGVQRMTISRALSGTENFNVTTLLAVADRLGLEVMLVPKEAARALRGAPGSDSAPIATVAEHFRNL